MKSNSFILEGGRPFLFRVTLLETLNWFYVTSAPWTNEFLFVAKTDIEFFLSVTDEQCITYVSNPSTGIGALA